MKSVLRFVFLMLLVRCSFAYEFNEHSWTSPTAVFYVNLPGYSYDYNIIFADAASEWRDAGFVFDVYSLAYADGCQLEDSINSASFSPDECDEEFGEGTLAVTIHDAGVDVETDIVFNSNLLWDFYYGEWLDITNDFRRVALHELGHALGLDHEDDVDSIMNTFAGDITNLQSDDYNGVKALYYTETITASSQSSRDGWILESTETSKKGGKLNSSDKNLIVGDSASDQQYRSILSFDTSGIPNGAVITNATLVLKKSGSTGSVSSLGALVADIRTNYFGASTSLSTSDFEASASKNSAATLTVSGGFYGVDLGSSAIRYISKTGTTQFRLRFTKDDNDDKGADYLKFYSGNYSSTSSRPNLLIEYFVP